MKFLTCFFKPASLVGVQNLIKKQEAVDAEITAHEQLINTVMSTADQLIEREHYAADEIEARCADLQEKWAELTSLSATRQQNLQESQKAQQVRRKLCKAWRERARASSCGIVRGRMLYTLNSIVG